MPTIIVHSEAPCRQCGQGKSVDQPKTAANALALLGVLKKQDVAAKMGISPSYLGDLLVARRLWNSELAEKFEGAVAALKV